MRRQLPCCGKNKWYSNPYYLLTVVKEGLSFYTLHPHTNGFLYICLMRWLIYLLCLACVAPLFGQSTVAGELIVQLHPSALAITDTLPNDAFGQANLTFRPLSKAANIWLAQYDTNTTTAAAAIRTLRADERVAVVQTNHLLQYRLAPDDPFYSNQWPLHNTGQSGGTAGDDIDAEKAWALTTGGITSSNDTIVVAVIDGGYDIFHEDLDPNLFRNRHEIPNNGIDDDNNGKIDDYRGWDFPFQSDTPFVDFHGTAVAGIIGAAGNNGKGITGVNWAIKMLPIAMGQITESATIEAMDYAWTFRRRYNASNGQEGAFVVAVNMSFGLDFVKADSMPIWCSFYDSLGQAGILCVASTMNRDANVDSVGDMPTSCGSDYLLSVTNTNHNDQKVGLAAYGAQSIDLGAPGEDTYTTAPNDNYNYFDGTSAAAPHVAGAIGLLYASSCEEIMAKATTDPSTLAKDIKQMILDGTDPLPALAGITVSGGRLNLYNSLLLAENYGACVLASIGEGGAGAGAQHEGLLNLYPNPARQQVTISYRNTNNGNNQFQLLNSLGQVVAIWEDQISGPGVHTFTTSLEGYPAGIYFVRLTQGLRQSPLHTLVIQ